MYTFEYHQCTSTCFTRACVSVSLAVCPRAVAPSTTFSVVTIEFVYWFFEGVCITCGVRLVTGHQDMRMPDAAEVLQQAHGAIDTNLKGMWDSLNANALFVVVSLGGNTAYTRWLHELRTKRQGGATGYPAWSTACEEFYLQQLDQSVCGCVWAKVKQ